ncbi:MAG: hypothetical protein EA352_07755 [Gemmatimonadales bacterium]|nr:MAG: hypothetical protein EA352_07755 [Gemmatimonadales bacterium]
MILLKRSLALVALGFGVLAGCNYTFQAGAGLPSDARTVAFQTFENETDRLEVSQELYDAFLEEFPSTFGVQVASEENADVLVRGSIRQYSLDAPSYRSDDRGGAEVVERRVNISIAIQIIDVRNQIILWENTSLSERGEYLEASQLEEDGRELAISRLVRATIDGLQSNW